MSLLMWPILIASGAAVIDLRKREIPDVFAFLLIGSAMLMAVWDVDGSSIISRCAALVFCLAVTLPGFSRGALGGGDVKLLAGLACWFGFAGTPGLLFWTAIAGAGLALASVLRGKKDLAFGPAIAIATTIQSLAPHAIVNLVNWLQSSLA